MGFIAASNDRPEKSTVALPPLNRSQLASAASINMPMPAPMDQYQYDVTLVSYLMTPLGSVCRVGNQSQEEFCCMP